MKKCSKKLKLNCVNISTKSLTSGDSELFNDNALLNQWSDERVSHGNNEDEIVSSSEYMEQLIERLGTKYIAWCGLYSYNEIRSQNSGFKNTYFFFVVDLETGKVMKFEVHNSIGKDHADTLNSFIYNSLMFVAKKSK